MLGVTVHAVELCNNLQRLGDSVFSPDKRSMDAERASLRTDAQPKRKRAEYAGLKAQYRPGVNISPCFFYVDFYVDFLLT